jgi:hypothetical protein
MVPRLLRAIEYGIWNARGSTPVVDVLKLKGDLEVCITTKRIGPAIHWMVTDWIQKHVWAAGSFVAGDNEHREESAGARPVIRGRGLYQAVLKYIRKEYKRPLISDRTISKANLLSWVRAGGVIDTSDARMRINPGLDSRIRCFLALEAVGC